MDQPPLTEVQQQELTSLLLEMLRRSYWAESYMTGLMEELQSVSVTPRIATLLEIYKLHIKRQADILSDIFAQIEQNASQQRSAAFESLWKESAQSVYKAAPGSRLRDTAIIISVQQMAAQKAANYQIIASFLRLLNYSDIAGILEDCLIEEKERHAEFTEVAAAELFTTGNKTA